MKLAELDPQFLRVESPGHWLHVPTLGEAHGVRFLCPKCFVANGGPVGTHGVICWSRSRGAPDDERPLPGRWAMVGTDVSDLTLNGDSGASRSIALNGGCAWHGYITNGEVTDA